MCVYARTCMFRYKLFEHRQRLQANTWHLLCLILGAVFLIEPAFACLSSMGSLRIFLSVPRHWDYKHITVRISIGLVKHYGHQQLGLLFQTIAFQPHSNVEGNQGRNSNRKLETEVDTEGMEECCLLARFSKACPAHFLIAAKTTSKGGITHGELDPLTVIAN